ncbi:MAG: hypothetical protein JSU08_10295 [Acidobacteria bacterium]|nr:hypothetical protein [Acidobacteriota bacterium]
MILRMVWKSLVAHPVRTAVLGVGFGLGVSVMATLLGVGEVVLDQARSPKLAGGGDLLITGLNGPVSSARFVLARLQGQQGVGAASPRRRADLFVVGSDGRTTPITAHGGIPSLERAIGDPETSGVDAWVDRPGDERWASPDPSDVLRAMDRFHPVPDVPARAASWAEWLYFKGRAGDVQFYMTFLAGPTLPDGRRTAGVRFQLDRGGVVTSYAASEPLEEAALLRTAPDMTIGGARVRLEGMRYHITMDLPRMDNPARGRVTGEFYIDAVAGRSLTPIELRGAGGWVSGYTVPVMSGALSGGVVADGQQVSLSGTGYHDHNWGFWQGVSWRWGQVQHEGLSYVYGRVIPPADAADPERLPGFLVALGPDGPIGYATRVTIDETDVPGSNRPSRIVVSGRARDFDLRMEIDVESLIVNKGGALAAGPDFLQLRANYHVTGSVGGQQVDFRAPGAAETFRDGAGDRSGGASAPP